MITKLAVILQILTPIIQLVVKYCRSLSIERTKKATKRAKKTKDTTDIESMFD